MSNYHRLFIKGGTYFFTLVTHDRQPFLSKESTLRRLKTSFRYAMNKHPFLINGMVILPDHIHCIWQLPENDNNYSIRWNLIKRFFSTGISCSTNQRREKNIWQRRFWEHLIRNEEELFRCLDYIHYNPVKHGYVKSPCEWESSSFKRYVRQGFYDFNWGSNEEPDRIKKLLLNE